VNTDQYIAVQLVAQQGDGKGEPPGGLLTSPIPLLVAMMVMFYFLVLRPNRRQERARQAMIDALKKNAKVVTIGGIVGTIVSIRRDEDEVTLESANSRLRILRSSIARVITPGEQDESDERTATGSDADSPDARVQRKD
jgi:preprotein translocase subunit YajC